MKWADTVSCATGERRAAGGWGHRSSDWKTWCLGFKQISLTRWLGRARHRQPPKQTGFCHQAFLNRCLPHLLKEDP
jgi:hypothetical protein